MRRCNVLLVVLFAFILIGCGGNNSSNPQADNSNTNIENNQTNQVKQNIKEQK